MSRAAGPAVLAAEVLGCLLLWAPIPVAWMWVGARVYDATGSLSADLAVALGGFFATTVVTVRALNRIDGVWLELRRQAGYDQVDGALTRVVVVSTTVALLAFWVWFHIVQRAFVIPFMPNR